MIVSILTLGNNAGADVEIFDFNSSKNTEHMGFVKSNNCNAHKFANN